MPQKDDVIAGPLVEEVPQDVEAPKETKTAPTLLNPDAKKVAAGQKKLIELDEQENELRLKLADLKAEKRKVNQLVMKSMKQATLGQCLVQLRQTERVMSPFMMMGLGQKGPQFPILPGASNDEEKAAAAKLKGK